MPDKKATVLVDRLRDLSDVNATSPSDGQALTYNQSTQKWIPGSGGASIGGSVTNGSMGSVLFVNPDNTLSQDNQGFRYDDTNNRLSVFTTLSSELLTNPNFTGNATGWTVPAGMAYSSNSVSKTSNGTGALTQSVTPHITSEYELTYTLSNVTAGTVTPSWGGFTGTARSANGTYTERFVATSSTSTLAFTPSNTARFTIDTISLKKLRGTNTLSNVSCGGLNVQGEWSNGSPGTTRAQTINNEGSYTWTDYRFSGTLRSAIGANSSGGLDMYASGSNYFSYYYGNSGLTSNSMFAYNYPTAFVHYGGGWFSSGVHAGSASTNTSTLQSAGGLALKVKKITASQSLDNTATHWLCDASTAVCTGTPSAACSSWTNQTDCEKWDAHGGCSWNPGYSCSTYNGNQSGCEGQSGCTYETANCSGFGDESTCNSYSGCSWSNNPLSCSGFDESTCGMTSGCTINRDYCYNYSDAGGDGTACATVSGNGCSYDSGSGSCSDGMGDAGWFTGCSGSYDNYSCAGTYYTGNCTGTYGAACSGTSSCAGIDDSTNCGNETGCTWSTAINVTLPQISTAPDRTYWIYNDSSTNADVNILPYSGETVNYTTSVVLSTYKDGVHLAPLTVTASCSGFNNGACTPSGCSRIYCTWNSGDSTCNGGASCTGIGDESTCNSTFDYCSGTYVYSKNWYVFSRT